MKEKSELLKKALRSSGRRLTGKRSLVLDLLQRLPGHLDVDTIFMKAKEVDPRISMATVYRTLALLKKVGLVEESRLGEAHAHYESGKEEPHFHFTCASCGLVVEFQTPLISRLKSRLEKKEKVSVSDIHIDASGYCFKCRGKKRRKA